MSSSESAAAHDVPLMPRASVSREASPKSHWPDLHRLADQLAMDARALLIAEIGLVKSRALVLFRQSRLGAGLLLAAPCVALSALMASMVGLMIAVMPQIGPLLSAAAILVFGMLVAGVLGWIGLNLLAPRKARGDHTPGEADA